MTKRYALVLGLLVACTVSSRATSADEVRPSAGPSASKEESTVASAKFTFLRRHREHPPLSTLEFDVSLRNPGDRARWFLLPAQVAKGQGPIDSAVFGASVFAFPGQGKVVVARFQGAVGFYALRLPAGAEVELRGLGIRSTGDLPANPLRLEVVVADAFTIGGDPPEVWTKSTPASDVRADVAQKGATRLVEYTTPDLKSRPVALQGAQRLTETVPIHEP
jgi:hypothetical protein